MRFWIDDYRNLMITLLIGAKIEMYGPKHRKNSCGISKFI